MKFQKIRVALFIFGVTWGLMGLPASSSQAGDVNGFSHRSLAFRAGAFAKSSSKKIELWCGEPSGLEHERFPYLTAIRSWKVHGKEKRQATVYRNGHVVYRQYVAKINSVGGVSYQAPQGTYNLVLNRYPSEGDRNNGHRDRQALKAQFDAQVVERSENGKLISNGSFACHRS